MLRLLRLFIIGVMTGAFWAAWYSFPDVLEPDSITWMAGVGTCLWGLEFYFYQRLSQVSPDMTFTSEQNARLCLRLASIRNRVWWTGAIVLVCSFLIWLLARTNLPISAPIYAALLGFLLGINLSYLVLIPFWFSELLRFSDERRRRTILREKRKNLSLTT